MVDSTPPLTSRHRENERRRSSSLAWPSRPSPYSRSRATESYLDAQGCVSLCVHTRVRTSGSGTFFMGRPSRVCVCRVGLAHTKGVGAHTPPARES